METKLEQIAAKARCDAKLRFTSLAHHITRERVWRNLNQIPRGSAPGTDDQTVTEAKESFGKSIDPMLQSVHRMGYRAPDFRRVYILSLVNAKSAHSVFLLSVTGRSSAVLPRCCLAYTNRIFCHVRLAGGLGVGAHNGLATLNEIIAGRKVGWMLEADLKNFFGT